MIKRPLKTFGLTKNSVASVAHRHMQGFSLVELMVTFAVIAILATIAIPAYSEYVKEGKVAEATSTLADLRIRTEQFFQDNRTYINAPCLPPANTVKHFIFTCDAGPTTYTITATGRSDQSLSGFRFTIDQNNLKTSIYEGVPGDSCWITKKGGTCQ